LIAAGLVPELVVAVQAVDDAAGYHVDIETDDVTAEVRRLAETFARLARTW